ncbi:MAG: alpha-galactosidase [Deltaproteobacteria bacterium]|nr:alpha-galactosidase [Deltaproteobacteria bacterium]
MITKFKGLLPAVLVVLQFLAQACSNGKTEIVDERYITLQGSGFEVKFDLEKGRYDVSLDDGTLILENAFAEVETGVPTEIDPVVFRTSDDYLRAGSKNTSSDKLGSAERAQISFSGLAGAPDLTLSLAAYTEKPFFTAMLTAKNTSADQIILARLVPAKVDADRRGGLWLGQHPSNHRILEAGSFFLFDFFVDLVPGDVAETGETSVLGIIHGYQKGHSISNCNHAIKDLDSGRTFVAGTLDFEYSSPMLNTAFLADQARTSSERTSFSYWSAEFPYMYNGKPLEPDQELIAGPVFVIPGTMQTFDGLEAYAEAVKAWNEIELWPERGPENRVPTGWNSWTGSGSSGGYGTNIDQQLMVENLVAMATEFKDFGGEWFQLDDGYEYDYGDWDWREDRFPDGADWLSDQIQQHGLIPGVWIAIFQVSENSQLYQDHLADGWFPDQIPLAGGGAAVLDLSHPQVLDMLRSRFRKIRADGYRWIKTDFGYWALGGTNYYDPSVTREEAFRRGLTAIREGLDLGAADAGGTPGDTFWLTVAMVGPHMGHVDSVRPNLDTMPTWEKEKPSDGRKSAQGVKPAVRIIGRRYYQHNRVNIFNHDLIFFRAHADPEVTPLTADESRCLLTAIGLSGGVAKLGERIIEMEPDWINDYRRIIPVYGHAARPLDLFEREFSEVWHMRVDPSQGLNTRGSGPAYDVVALFNWGQNFDLTTNPYSEMPDQERSLSLDLGSVKMNPNKDYVAREFWTGEVIESLSQTLTRSLAPHTVQMFALREIEDRPQFIGNNRHFLQGAVEVLAVDWNSATKTLSLTYDAAPGSLKAAFEHQLDFRVPTGWSLDSAAVDGAASGTTTTEQVGQVLILTFSVTTRQDVTVSLVFTAP